MLSKVKGVQRKGTRGKCIGNWFSLTICLNVNLVVPGGRIEQKESKSSKRPLSSLLNSCASCVDRTHLGAVFSSRYWPLVQGLTIRAHVNCFFRYLDTLTIGSTLVEVAIFVSIVIDLERKSKIGRLLLLSLNT